ncbi:MAG: VanZ family protein [Candidatus Aenigmatarchaeota archaeon]
MKRRYFRIATVCWIIIIIILATIRQTPGGIEIPLLDRITHFFEFFILSVLLFKTFTSEKGIIKNAYKTIILAILYSIIMEIYQLFIPWRYFSFYDIATNLLGTFLGVYIVTNFTNYFSDGSRIFQRKL